MIAFLVVMLIMLAVYAVHTRKKLTEVERRAQFWYGKWQNSIAEFVDISHQYEALEQGSDEIEENYQQDMLDLFDKIEALANSNKHWEGISHDLEKIRLDHDVFCLPVLGKDFYPMAEEDETPIYDSVVG